MSELENIKKLSEDLWEEAVCPHDEFCGGCIYQGTPYEKQLEIKMNMINDLIVAKECPVVELCDIEPSPRQKEYRNKMEYTFGDLEKDGEMTLGMHRKGRFMSVVTVDKCQLVHPDFNIILKETLVFAKGYTKYHKKTHKGLLRNLIIRRGVRTNQLLINIVTTSQGEFDGGAYVNMLQSLRLSHTIVSILHTINDNISDSVQCQKLKTLFGQDYYMEKICGLDFKVSAFSFFQTNIEAVENLYSEALNLLPEAEYKDKTVWDLFCGTGTISQMLAQKAKAVVGIELIEEAVEAAKENGKLNKLTNCRFIAGDVLLKLEEIESKPDLIVVDPPRVGIHNKALDKIIATGVKEIIYISCNPKTFFDNAAYLAYFGYQIKILKPFDNFAGTKHVECIALIQRVKS